MRDPVLLRRVGYISHQFCTSFRVPPPSFVLLSFASFTPVGLYWTLFSSSYISSESSPTICLFCSFSATHSPPHNVTLVLLPPPCSGIDRIKPRAILHTLTHAHSTLHIIDTSFYRRVRWSCNNVKINAAWFSVPKSDVWNFVPLIMGTLELRDPRILRVPFISL